MDFSGSPCRRKADLWKARDTPLVLPSPQRTLNQKDAPQRLVGPGGPQSQAPR